MKRKNKGFTLIEMLVVIAIIAVLVSVIIPTVTAATDKAKGATDAANLRSILGEANVILLDNTSDGALDQIGGDAIISKTYPDATMRILYHMPGFIDAYYVDGDNYYSLEYFADIAANGSTAISSAKPDDSGCTWYTVGGGD